MLITLGKKLINEEATIGTHCKIKSNQKLTLNVNVLYYSIASFCTRAVKIRF